MKKVTLPRILIGATGSGCGKTTVVCGILQALKNRGKNPVAFKCGPDYIDPMFHEEVLGIASLNLDLFFMSEDSVRKALAKNAKEAQGEFAIIEGVMGYYDGLGGISHIASSYNMALATKTPAILIVNARGKSFSLVAEIKGFLELEKDSNIGGVILNEMTAGLYEEIKKLIEEKLSIKVLGYLPAMKEYSLESRHLGLVTAQEVGNLKPIIDGLARQCEATLDLDGILELGELASKLESEEVLSFEKKIRVGIAKDKAFCFYYKDNLEALRAAGCEIVEFSPISDEELPENLQGLYFGGGYPELYLGELSGNKKMLGSVRKAIDAGMPTIAECGGFMYLHENIKDKDGNSYSMVGTIKGESFFAGRLVRFGYVEIEALEENLLCKKGGAIKGHEFHYWDSTNAGNSFRARKPLRNTSWDCVVGNKNFYGGYPHIYLNSNIEAAERFVQACIKNRKLMSGITTGTCAAAAAKAAALSAITGSSHNLEQVKIALPGGSTITVQVKPAENQMDGQTSRNITNDGTSTFAVQKYSGDDPDITDGIYIYATVDLKKDTKEIKLIGGEGVGRVTLLGLACEVGEAAINPVPKEMIKNSVREAFESCGYEGGGIITITVPEGKEIAKKTYNPRLGIEGGISILGTSGIVKPMSNQALIDTIEVEMNVRKAAGAEYLVLTPGNYGEEFLKTIGGRLCASVNDPKTYSVKISNFLGESLDLARGKNFKGILLVGHMGKLVKVAGGIMNTHSACGDCRMEILAAHGAFQGASQKLIKEIMSSITTDCAYEAILEEDALKINEEKIAGKIIAGLIEKIKFHVEERIQNTMEVHVIMFSNKYGFLGATQGFEEASHLYVRRQL